MKTFLAAILITYFAFTSYTVTAQNAANKNANDGLAGINEAQLRSDVLLKVNFKELTDADVSAIGQKLERDHMDDVAITASDVSKRTVTLSYSGKPEDQRKIQQVFFDLHLSFYYNSH